ncbi:unnamed protein product [Urochloa humidicola]
MCFGAQVGEEIEGLQLRVLLSVTTFLVFASFPAVTKCVFRRRWEENVRQWQEEVFIPLIFSATTGDDTPPCYTESLRVLRIPDQEEGGERPLTDAEMAKLRDELINDGGDVMSAETPYLKAVVMEGLRLHPPGHFVLPHGVHNKGNGNVVEIGRLRNPQGRGDR